MADFSGRDLAWLERRRAELFALIAQAGDFRRGALNAVWRKCGKPNCACAQPGHRGHGPQWNLTRRVGGKTVNVHLKPGPELEKAQREVAEHQRFADLVEEVSQVSEAICAARPVTAGAWVPPAGRAKGGLAARLEEIAAAEVGRLAGMAAGMRGAGAALGVLEQAMRAALTSAGARMLEAVLAGEDGYCGPRARCGCGGRAGYAGSRDKTVTTVLGPVTLRRAWYHCRECHSGFAPEDERLGVGGVSVSAGLAEMIALAGAEVSFARAAGLLSGLAGISVSARTIERSAEASGAAARAAAGAEAAAITARAIVPMPPPAPVPDMLYVEVDGTGVPVRASETEGRQGKDADGRAGTREVKLARLFTVSRLDDEGRPVTDPGSSSYAFTFDGKDALAGFVKAEYLRRGGEHFRQVVALGDGAAWIWSMATDLYPHATHIVDIYHAREHLHDLAAHLAFITPDPPSWLAGQTQRARRRRHRGHRRRRPRLPARRHQSRRAGQEDRLLRAQHPPDALRPLQKARHVHRIRPHRGRLQANRRPARQAIRHALDRRRRRRHHRAALPARQWPLGRALATQHRHCRRAPRSHLTDTATQTLRSPARARSSPTMLSCTPRWRDPAASDGRWCHGDRQVWRHFSSTLEGVGGTQKNSSSPKLPDLSASRIPSCVQSVIQMTPRTVLGRFPASGLPAPA